MNHHLRRGAIALLSATALLLLLPGPASAMSNSGTDTRTVPSRIFSSGSPFYQRLPSETPAAPDSKELVASLNSQAHEFYGTPTEANVTINHKQYTPALYVARNSDPVYDIKAWSCQSHSASVASYLNSQLMNVHVPADMVPDPSADGSVSIYNPDTKEIVELWKARKVYGQWQACWGGRILDADKSLGTFSLTYGASASGMALWATTIRQQELLDGRIDHLIGLSIPYTKAGSVSWPAVRTDGWMTGTQLSIGQMLRLPASLNLDAMKLSPAARTIAKAAQEYGIIVTDTSGSVSFAAENSIALANDQYSSIFRGRWTSQEMAGDKTKGEVAFPLDKLVALPMNYRAPTTTGTTPGSVTLPPSTATNTAYSAAVKRAEPALYWRLNDTGLTAADASGNEKTGTFANVRQAAAGAIAGDTAIATYGNSTSGAFTKAQVTPSAAFSAQLWFRTRTQSGGKLLGFENVKTGYGTRYDRSVYMANNGTLVFGTYAGKVNTVTTPKSYNDGAWHMVTATQGRTGMRLYVDGVLVASRIETTAESGSGYWRLGGGNLTRWPSVPTSSHFEGSLDEFAIYNTALSADTISAQYRAAS